MAPLGFELGFRIMFIFQLILLIVRGYPQILVEQILEGKSGVWDPYTTEPRLQTTDLRPPICSVKWRERKQTTEMKVRNHDLSGNEDLWPGPVSHLRSLVAPDKQGPAD